MRKSWIFVPMMILLLSGCSLGSGSRETDRMALDIQNEYRDSTECAARASIVSDYGQRIHSYEMEVAVSGERTTLTITAPEEVAGISAVAEGVDTFLEYGELVLETGPLDGEGLTPVSAVPVLLEAARNGMICCCTMEEKEDLLRVEYGDPQREPGQGREVTIWFSPSDHSIRQGEIALDGVRVISCTFEDFTMR